MRRQAAQRWQAANAKYLAANERTSDVASGLGGLSKVFRSISPVACPCCRRGPRHQSGIDGRHHHSGIDPDGESACASGDGDRQLERISSLHVSPDNGWISCLNCCPRKRSRSRCRRRPKRFVVEQLCVAAPDSEKLILNDVSFQLRKGEAVGIIGPSGAGKSTLARALVGVWPRVRGKIKLDNAALDQWSSEALGRHIGYLPQDIELFEGSIAVNIARFDLAATPDARSGSGTDCRRA